MSDFDWSAVDWPSLFGFAAVCMLLLWGIAYNGAKGAAYRVEAETRRDVPESHVRQSATCTVLLLVGAAVMCGGVMIAFQLFYAWYQATP